METCKCGQSFESSRGLKLHQKIHCKFKAKSPAVKKECDCKDGGSWEFRSNLVDENGSTVNPETGKKYKKICTECREVI